MRRCKDKSTYVSVAYKCVLLCCGRLPGHVDKISRENICLYAEWSPAVKSTQLGRRRHRNGHESFVYVNKLDCSCSMVCSIMAGTQKRFLPDYYYTEKIKFPSQLHCTQASSINFTLHSNNRRHGRTKKRTPQIYGTFRIHEDKANGAALTDEYEIHNILNLFYKALDTQGGRHCSVQKKNHLSLHLFHFELDFTCLVFIQMGWNAHRYISR